MTVRLDISLFGTCAVHIIGGVGGEIRGAKHRALIAILATAPLGRRTRSYLQNTLWGQSDYDSGHQNLRRALADLRKLLGDDFDTIIHTTNSDVELDLEHVRFISDPSTGMFLEDLNLAERDFQDWVNTIRRRPEQIGALFRTAPRARMRRHRPRVTVLPLGHIGDDPSLSILGDWIAEQSCRYLSRSNLMSVISHLSSRVMAQKRIVIPDVRETLEVDYLLTGTIRPDHGAIVCDFDFIEAETGQILWNRSLTIASVNALDDLHAKLNDVVHAVARAIAESAVTAAHGQTMADIADHNLMIAGVSLMHRRTMRDFLRSREFLIEATERMPNMAEPLAWLGKWYILYVFKGFSVDRAGDIQKAVDCTARALDIDPESSFGLTIDGFANSNLLKNFDLAAKRYDAALKLNPNESLAWLLTGSLNAFKDDGLAAIEATRTARRLSPIDPFGYYYDSLASTAHLAAENYAEALEFANRSLEVNDRHVSTLRVKVTALHFMGRTEEARAAAVALKRRLPDFTLDDYRRDHPSAHHKLGQNVLQALAASGIE